MKNLKVLKTSLECNTLLLGTFFFWWFRQMIYLFILMSLCVCVEVDRSWRLAVFNKKRKPQKTQVQSGAAAFGVETNSANIWRTEPHPCYFD